MNKFEMQRFLKITLKLCEILFMRDLKNAGHC